MKPLKECLKDVIDHLHEHHGITAAAHSAACDDDQMSEGSRRFHKTMAQHHAEMCDKCKGMSAECDKAADILELAKVISQVADASVKAEFTRAGLTPPPNRIVTRAGDPLLVKAEDSEQVAEIFG